MNANGKVSQLPPHIREDLNRRLQTGLKQKRAVEWLNSLPEVQALVQSKFEGIPISTQNMSEWCKHGYRHWRLRAEAIAFATNVNEDDHALQNAFSGDISEKLSRWAALNYAAAAQSLSAKNTNADPQTTLRLLHDLCSDISVLRRGDLSAARLEIEERRLKSELARDNEQKEREFWDWTRRPDIQAKLYPHRDPDQIRRDVDEAITRKLLGANRPQPEEIHHDPACDI